MEILIVGVLLVGLMIYASTRIKRTAAEAFDAERIENDRFVIDKPEGFLNVLNLDPKLEFDAYSREFGLEHASSFRAARAELRVYAGQTIDEAIAAIAGSATVRSDVSEIIDGRKYHVIEAESVEKGIGFRDVYKLAQNDSGVFEMKLKMLETADEEVVKKAELMLASFEIK